MSNPYALPLRLRRGRLTDLRQGIAAAANERTALLARDQALCAQAPAERRLRSAAPEVGGEGWFGWYRSRRELLARQIARQDQRLAELREAVRDELGQISALEKAEGDLLAGERRRQERKAQAAADDRAAGLFLLSAAS